MLRIGSVRLWFEREGMEGRRIADITNLAHENVKSMLYMAWYEEHASSAKACYHIRHCSGPLNAWVPLFAYFVDIMKILRCQTEVSVRTVLRDFEDHWARPTVLFRWCI